MHIGDRETQSIAEEAKDEHIRVEESFKDLIGSSIEDLRSSLSQSQSLDAVLRGDIQQVSEGKLPHPFHFSNRR